MHGHYGGSEAPRTALPGQRAFSALVKAYARSGAPSLAEEQLWSMQREGKQLVPTHEVCEVVLAACLRNPHSNCSVCPP